MHMPKGIPSAVPRSMDPQYQQQQMMQQLMAQQMSQQPRMGMKDGGTWEKPTHRDILEQVILSQKYPDREAALPHDKALDVLRNRYHTTHHEDAFCNLSICRLGELLSW